MFNVTSPARTLFVAQSWKGRIDPSVYFTNLSNALTVASSMAPTDSNPILIILYPGSYFGNVQLVSNVYLHAFDGTVSIGPITWNPGVGINAPQNDITESMFISDMNISGFTINTTTKTNGGLIASFNMEGISVNSDSIITLRTGIDTFIAKSSVFGGTVSQTGGGVQLYDVAINDVTTVSGGGFQLFTSQLIANVILSSGSNAQIHNSSLSALIIQDTSTADAFECNIVNVTNSGIGNVNIRNSGYSSLSGSGPIQRSIWRTTTAGGVGLVSLSPPYIDTNYSVMLTQTSGGTTTTPVVSLKTVSNFTLTSPAGTTYDVVVIAND